jgi:CubicO group peptidase (beta-lactamase class C family)
MTTIGIMRLVERGQLALTTRVASIIPEFAQRGKAQITIAQLLTHTAGLGSAPVPLPANKLGDLAAAAAAVCTLTPETVPGEKVSYSGTTAFTILGEIISRLDEKGRRYGDILAEDIFQPLGMGDTAVGLPDRFHPRRVPVVVRATNAPELNAAALEARERATDAKTEMPSGGVYSTAQDMLRFAEALRCQGTLDGATILSPASLALMRKNHTGSKPNSLLAVARTIHGFDEFPAFLGLGLFLRGEGIFPMLFGSLASPGTFGGFGLGSTTLWIDPERDVTFVALTSGLMERIDSILRFQTLSDIVLGGLKVAA